MKQLFLIVLSAIVLCSCCSCSPNRINISYVDYEELEAALHLRSDDPEAEADFQTSDLRVREAYIAFSNLKSYVNGAKVSKRTLMDSLTYLERYIRALENDFDYLYGLIK